ncbi:DUF2849 domain-containing protein [uncultured Sulfitobacter sp.]|uniref:DUF2849 domain-containing protein n=1 Tax=uncultured Sulfitobacter sp. TaxID=191468 RepID=UPI0026242155|nr:DUF2849 domain-containing protein [uncultured Sulfitobacter sp.]
MTKGFKPKVATANHLIEGDVIYFTSEGWSRRIETAAVARTAEDAEALIEQAGQCPQETAGASLIDVDLSTGIPRPVHFREVFRTRGPSNYFHGKQADHV